MILEPGRVCLKIAGREGGKYCVILDSVDPSSVNITGPKSITGIKRRKCNIFHVEPTEHLLNISKNATDPSVEAAWKESGLIEKLKIEVPKKKERKVAKKETK